MYLIRFSFILVIFISSFTFSSFGDNEFPRFEMISLKFTDNSLKKVYVESMSDNYGYDTTYLTFGDSGHDATLVHGGRQYFLNSYADTIICIKQKASHNDSILAAPIVLDSNKGPYIYNSIDPFYFGIKKRSKVVNDELYIGKRKINKNQNVFLNTNSSNIPFNQAREVSSSWNFHWADSLQAASFEHNNITFSKTFVFDNENMTAQWRVISFSPLITLKNFLLLYHKNGLKDVTITDAIKQGKLVIIEQPTD